MELYVFGSNINYKGILEDYSSLIWNRRYSTTGDFEIHCNFSLELMSLLEKGNLIWKNDDLEVGYIKYRNLVQDSDGKEILIIKGKFLTDYADKRIVWGRNNIFNTAELIMRELINKNIIAPDIPDRRIDNFILGDLKNYTESIKYQSSFENVLEELEKLALENEYGIRTLIDVNNKKAIFDIYKGLDRTSGNGVNDPAVFAREFDNILEQEYIDSIDEYRNVTLIAGEGEGTERKLEVVGQGVGLERYESYTDARDLQSSRTVGEVETPIPDNEYRQMLRDRGVAKLSETKKIEMFNSKIDLNSNLIYKEDFNLGDTVTCYSKNWGVTVNTRITEIQEVYENEGKSVFVVFGNEIPTIIEKIKREVR